jgi:hypothetical protein
MSVDYVHCADAGRPTWTTMPTEDDIAGVCQNPLVPVRQLVIVRSSEMGGVPFPALLTGTSNCN